MGVKYTGTPIASNITSIPPQECQGYCKKNNDCSKFVWNGTSCLLFNTTDGSEDNDDYISGPKNCRKLFNLDYYH